jgi:hypothetical protein
LFTGATGGGGAGFALAGAGGGAGYFFFCLFKSFNICMSSLDFGFNFSC